MFEKKKLFDIWLKKGDQYRNSFAEEHHKRSYISIYSITKYLRILLENLLFEAGPYHSLTFRMYLVKFMNGGGNQWNMWERFRVEKQQKI